MGLCKSSLSPAFSIVEKEKKNSLPFRSTLLRLPHNFTPGACIMITSIFSVHAVRSGLLASFFPTQNRQTQRFNPEVMEARTAAGHSLQLEMEQRGERRLIVEAKSPP
jgi:hypothetical protein